MAVVTAVYMIVITDSSGHVMTPMAVSVCITPAAPAPLPIPYPVIGNTSDGVTDSALRTKINGSVIITVGSVFKACHGNEAGTLKEVVSLNTGGPCFIIIGAPTVLCELGMMGITGSAGFLNKAITVGMNGTASDASGSGAGGGGGGSDGSGDGTDKGPDNPEGGGGSGGAGTGTAGAHDAPTEAERKLAAEEGNTPEHIAARKKVANDFFKKEGKKWDPHKKQMRPHTDAERESELRCIDFNKPVKAGTTPPPKTIYQTQAPGRQNPPGQYCSENPHATPGEMGIGKYGVSKPDGKVTDKVTTPYEVKDGTPYLNSTASPAKDTWSVSKDHNAGGVFQNGMTQSAPGGGGQTYIPNNGNLTQSGASYPIP